MQTSTCLVPLLWLATSNFWEQNFQIHLYRTAMLSMVCLFSLLLQRNAQLATLMGSMVKYFFMLCDWSSPYGSKRKTHHKKHHQKSSSQTNIIFHCTTRHAYLHDQMKCVVFCLVKQASMPNFHTHRITIYLYI